MLKVEIFYLFKGHKSPTEALRDMGKAPMESFQKALTNISPTSRWRPSGANLATEGVIGSVPAFFCSPQSVDRNGALRDSLRQKVPKKRGPKLIPNFNLLTSRFGCVQSRRH